VGQSGRLAAHGSQRVQGRTKRDTTLEPHAAHTAGCRSQEPFSQQADAEPSSPRKGCRGNCNGPETATARSNAAGSILRTCPKKPCERAASARRHISCKLANSTRGPFLGT